MTNYPTLSSLMTPSQLPDVLAPVGESIGDLLGKIRYHALAIEKSLSGETASYALTLITRELKTDLFGSGLSPYPISSARI
jgi:hypothetical protein